jgi:hypothetical protein
MRRAAGILVAGLMLFAFGLGYDITPASALSFTGTYYQIDAPGAPILNSPGVGNLGGSGNQSTSSLVNPVCGKFTCFGQTLNSVTGFLTSGQPTATGNHWFEGDNNPILLWTVGNHVGTSGNVSLQTTSLDTFFDAGGGSTSFLTSAGSSFFVGGSGSNNNSLYRSVHWTGLFSVAPTGASFSIQSDDHAFLYVDDTLEVDAGGIKAVNAGTFNGFFPFAPGNHKFDLFFADVFSSQSGLRVACQGCLDPVPEPTSLLLFGTTLAGLGAVVRRKFRRQDNTV